jgi:hypothetical protein
MNFSKHFLLLLSTALATATPVNATHTKLNDFSPATAAGVANLAGLMSFGFTITGIVGLIKLIKSAAQQDFYSNFEINGQRVVYGKRLLVNEQERSEMKKKCLKEAGILLGIGVGGNVITKVIVESMLKKR